jgi:hypothetical protein
MALMLPDGCAVSWNRPWLVAGSLPPFRQRLDQVVSASTIIRELPDNKLVSTGDFGFAPSKVHQTG